MFTIYFFSAIFATLAGVGATIIVTQSYLFKSFRESLKTPLLSKLINCPMCFGFHIGWVFQFLIMIYVHIITNQPIFILINLIPIFFQGCITSIIAYMVYLFIKDKE